MSTVFRRMHVGVIAELSVRMQMMINIYPSGKRRCGSRKGGAAEDIEEKGRGGECCQVAASELNIGNADSNGGTVCARGHWWAGTGG